jgi:predicted Rossmann fold flavoprotein
VSSSSDVPGETCDGAVAIVGAGAAGLATAIFLRRANPARTVLLLDGARRPGAKILVSGGTRCNVTNREVTEADFWGGRPAIIRRVLRAFPPSETIEFFHRLGVILHEEAEGKLFPTSGRSRDVLDALVRAAQEAGVRLLFDRRVHRLSRHPAGFDLETSRGPLTTREVVLATGGRSLPKTGSDGAGYGFAQTLGHTIVATTPALVPLILESRSTADIHRRLSGVSHRAEICIWVDGRIGARLSGSLLWTHFGVSGPVALNASRHWLRARVEGRPVAATLSAWPGRTFDEEEAFWVAAASSRPKATLPGVLSERLPASVASALVERLPLAGDRPLAHLSRSDRRLLVRALVERPLAVLDSRGYTFAEVTAGGVSLDEIDPGSMESRVAPGLFLVGEILDVDGRIGGFNFQWAWSSAFVAARALAARGRAGGPPKAATRTAVEP